MKYRRYTRAQRAIHWWVAALLAIQYLGQYAMVAAMERIEQTTAPVLIDFLITTAHTSMGLALLALTIWRVRLRRLNPVPVAGGILSVKLTHLVRLWHLSLYLAIAVMATTGAVSYYTELELATCWHEFGKWVLGILVIGHVLAGLAHWALLRDQVLQRMLGNSGDADTMTGSGRSSD